MCSFFSSLQGLVVVLEDALYARAIRIEFHHLQRQFQFWQSLVAGQFEKLTH